MTPLATTRASALAVRIHRDIAVPMSDGTLLRADLWLPEDALPCPVLLHRTPYDKSFALVVQGGLDPARAVARGYGVMVQDVRGRFASEGRFEPFVSEQADGADTIGWLREQPFCDGRVAMYGGSYPGAAQLLAAGMAPVGLSALVPHVTAADPHDDWLYQGGALQLGLALGWARNLAAGELERRELQGEDVSDLREQLEAALEDPWSDYRRLPLSDQPLLDELAPYFRRWLERPARDGFWERRSARPTAEHPIPPALHVAGWHDVFLPGSLDAFARMRALGAPGQRLVVGPWPHAGFGDAVGEVIYGPHASRYALDPTDLHLGFYDAVLGDHGDAGEASPVRLFVMGANRWRDADDWPPPGTELRQLHLRGDGRLTWEPAGIDDPGRPYRYDPSDPVPTTGGATLMPGHEASIALGSRDQRALHARPDVLLYRTEPLSEPLEVTGTVTLTLHAATSGPDTDWTAKLLDIHPDGRALGVTDGIVRARYRDAAAPGRLLEPGRPYRYAITVGTTSTVFGRGHRIGLELSSSNFPRFDRNANAAVEPARAGLGDFQVAEQHVFHSADRPSFLEVPAGAR